MTTTPVTPITLELTTRTDPRLLDSMARHYSQPKGFVGRNICYAILCGGAYYGHIVAGSATRFLPGRNEFLGLGDLEQALTKLNNLVNNIYYHVEPVHGAYPCRNFTSKVIAIWRERILQDWPARYNDPVIGFETLVEVPRTGECYKRDGWRLVGQTKGYTCKRIAGRGTDSWTGKRVWNTSRDSLRPKNVLVRRVD